MLFFDELRVVMNRANSLAASFRSENAETLILFVSWNVARDSGPFGGRALPSRPSSHSLIAREPSGVHDLTVAYRPATKLSPIPPSPRLSTSQSILG